MQPSDLKSDLVARWLSWVERIADHDDVMGSIPIRAAFLAAEPDRILRCHAVKFKGYVQRIKCKIQRFCFSRNLNDQRGKE